MSLDERLVKARARKRRNAQKRGKVGKELAKLQAKLGHLIDRKKEIRAFIHKLEKKKLQQGRVIVASWANLAGHPISDITMEFFNEVADKLNRTITVTTGTNHSKFTTSGNVSDHYDGHAGDFGNTANGGTAGTNDIAVAALELCGVSPANARTRVANGGLWNEQWKGHRIQIIKNTLIGGDHYNHAHLGVR